MAPNDSGAAAGLARPPFDEMVDGRGHVRPHWRSVIGAFAGLPPAELMARAARLDRAFADEGIATALAQDPGRPLETQPWRCDPVPLPIPGLELPLSLVGHRRDQGDPLQAFVAGLVVESLHEWLVADGASGRVQPLDPKQGGEESGP